MSESSEEGKGQVKPPYISFKTLANLWVRLGTDGLPARIDKSYLESTAGGYATVVIASLRWLDFLHEDGRPTDELRHMVAASEPERKELFAQTLRSKYPGLEAKATTNETQGQFLEYFTETWGLTGDTRRKAIAFYLGSSRWAGVTTGALWKTPSSNGGGPRKTATGGRVRPAADITDHTGSVTPSPPAGDKVSTALRGVLERLPKFGEQWTARERDMFKRSFDNVLEWDYPVNDDVVASSSVNEGADGERP